MVVRNRIIILMAIALMVTAITLIPGAEPAQAATRCYPTSQPIVCTGAWFYNDSTYGSVRVKGDKPNGSGRYMAVEYVLRPGESSYYTYGMVDVDFFKPVDRNIYYNGSYWIYVGADWTKISDTSTWQAVNHSDGSSLVVKPRRY